MNQKKQVNHKLKSKLIASSKDSFNIELIESLDDKTAQDIINISKDLKDIYGPNSILTNDNIHKYFKPISKVIIVFSYFSNITINQYLTTHIVNIFLSIIN